jgi:endonuclease/exonuclease/phosphatase family metal-dependent hydrolase
MPSKPDYAADIVARQSAAHLRVATFNCENLFDRPLAMNLDDNAKGQPYLDAFHELNSIFGKPVYSPEDKARILELMGRHRLTTARPQNKYLEFRKIRGQLLKRQGATVTVVANGRADWVGWIELKTQHVSDQAILNTARVIAAVDADIQVLCEIEDRPSLKQFHDAILAPILATTGRKAYPYILLVDGNDPRGIDVAILSRHPIMDISTHVFDVPGAPPIFSRDCAEYFVQVPGVGKPVIVMANHFTSKGSDTSGLRRRLPQSTQVKKILDDRMQQGFTHVIVAGDLNDTPAAPGLAPLMTHSALEDAVKRFSDAIDPTGKRLGTYETGRQQLDYVLMSPAVSAVAKHAGIERRGHYAPRSWKPFDTVTSERFQASDHHAVWVDLAL